MAASDIALEIRGGCIVFLFTSSNNILLSSICLGLRAHERFRICTLVYLSVVLAGIETFVEFDAEARCYNLHISPSSINGFKPLCCGTDSRYIDDQPSSICRSRKPVLALCWPCLYSQLRGSQGTASLEGHLDRCVDLGPQILLRRRWRINSWYLPQTQP